MGERGRDRLERDGEGNKEAEKEKSDRGRWSAK